MPEQRLPYTAQQGMLWAATLSAAVVICVANTTMKVARSGAYSLVAEMLYWGPRWVFVMECQGLRSGFFLHLVYRLYLGRNTLILQNLCRLGNFFMHGGRMKYYLWLGQCLIESRTSICIFLPCRKGWPLFTRGKLKFVSGLIVIWKTASSFSLTFCTGDQLSSTQ